MPVFQSLLQVKAERGGGFLLLIDPDRADGNTLPSLTEAARDCGVDAILVGTSLSTHGNFHRVVRQVKAHTDLPVIIFPGSHSQITPDADAILFTSLLSGRNPQFLIDEQVRGAPMIKEYGIEAIATGYLLIASGRYTSVQYMSNTLPIPSDKPDIVCAHALAAQYLGMSTVFLEAGSGAEYAVPDHVIDAVARYIDLPLIIGGGIRTPEEVDAKISAGASLVVVGDHFEKNSNDLNRLREFTVAAHPTERIPV
ncbi:MAG: geranylgeranylglyceryl/heptaprenylglyceryl phosphate synthase [candidate division Zixibacteria bacterium]|nr:geranylgeranylglyceryl/heptaprenylglyceryl phosphate synthase [candidate division Zixibacteria bacterium]